MTNSDNLQKMADDARKAEDTIEASKEAGKVLESTQTQIKNAQGVLALTNFEIEKQSKELEKIKKDSAETLKVEKEKLASIQVERQNAEKEFGAFLVSVKEEKAALETANAEYAKKLEKLEDSKRTNQAIIDEKKSYIEEAKKEGENLERTRVRAEADINGMKALQSKILEDDHKLQVQQESVKNSQLALDNRNNDLNQRQASIQLKEAQLTARESKVVEDETRVKNLILIQEEKETLLYKLEESLKLKGVELPKTEALKVEVKDDGGKTVSWKPELKGETKKEKPKKGKGK